MIALRRVNIFLVLPPARLNSDTSEITDTDTSTTQSQPEEGKRWVDLFDDAKARTENPVKGDDAKYTVFIPHIYAIMKEQKSMAEQLTKLADLFDEQNKIRGFPHRDSHVSVRVLPVGISVSH